MRDGLGVFTAVLGAISLMILALIKRESIDDFTARGEIRSEIKESANPASQDGVGKKDVEQKGVSKVVSIWALFADRRVVFFKCDNVLLPPKQRRNAPTAKPKGAKARH